MIGGCANRPQILAVAPPELVLPPEVERPCDLARLTGDDSLGALEEAYMRRGPQVLACDAARAMAVEILKAERSLREIARR